MTQVRLKSDQLIQINLRFYGSFFCGGSLLNENHVLTAAHCVTKKDTVTIINPCKLTVVVGDHKFGEKGPQEVSHEVEKIITHPHYNPGQELIDGSVIVSKYY